MKKKLSSWKIEDVVKDVLTLLYVEKVTFKCQTYLSHLEDETVDMTKTGRPTPWDVIYDEYHNEVYECQLKIPSAVTDKLVDWLKKRMGAPTELRERDDAVKDENGIWQRRVLDGKDPVWKFGRKGDGQLWIYPDGPDESYVDVRYYYEKN